MASEQPIPVTMVTGFLGAGKTTLLNHLLGQPDLDGTLAIINEFGEIGLDHLLLEVTDERMALLDNGCVCCTVREDLVQTLLEANQKRIAGELNFNRVILETTGLADPAPILHALMAHPELEEQFEIETVISLVDATSGAQTLRTHDEAKKQLACADQVILTKTDIARPDQTASTKGLIEDLNPTAQLHIVRNGDVASAQLFNRAYGTKSRDAKDYAGWMEADHEHQCDAHCDHEHHRHDGIATYAFTSDQPVDWMLFREWLDNLAALKGADLLRMKGIVNITEDADRPMVVHGVQHVFHRPKQLNNWPSDDRRTRLIFIVKNITLDTIERTLIKFAQLEPARLSARTLGGASH
ncbi:G3E family GTPase [Maritalea mobilis]|uniref:G3E family GTPase n=1 Tax=Maritalea mobilis TaxID=483324 RepID=A0A4R6VK80_9HYPH|nr:GTP-binding protein [Maritalea mobilis]TDQ62046.1 G3E family GTPase [Maritalea mobilis]